MIGQKLQYQIKKSEHPQDTRSNEQKSFRIYFKNPFFTKTIKLLTLNKFPKARICQYQYQSHPTYIEFISLNSNDQNNELKMFTQQIDSLLSDIYVTVAHNNKILENKYMGTMIKLLNFSACYGYKLVRKPLHDYKSGQLVIFFNINEQDKVRQLIESIQGFGDRIVGFSLQQRIQKYKIPDNYIRSTFKQLINCYGSELEASAVFYQLNITNMGVSQRKFKQAEYIFENWFLLLYIEGNLNNVHQFYLAVQHMLQSIPLFLIRFNQVRSIKLNQIYKFLPYQNECRMLDGKYLILMDRNMSQKFVHELKIGSYILNEEKISKKQRDILSVEIKTRRFKEFEENNHLNIQSINISDDHIVIQCSDDQVKRNIRYLTKYIGQFEYQSIQCSQFQPDSMVTQVFYQIFKDKIQKQFHVKFQKMGNKIVRTNFTIDSQRVVSEINSVRQKIISQFVYIPSLIPISPYQAKANKIEGMYKVEKNPSCFWQKSLRSVQYNLVNKTNITFVQLDNLTKYLNNITLITHNDLPQNSKIFQIIKSNKINKDHFLQNVRGVRPKRVLSFKTQKSLSFRQITLLYFDVKRINSRHVQQDIYNCFKQQKKQKKVSMIVGISSKRFIQQIFSKFIQKIYNMVHKQQINLQQLFIYYEQPSLLPQMQRILVNSKVPMPLITRDYFDQWSLLKMNNIKQFILSYYWNKDTYVLPGIDSYTVFFQKTKSSKGRALVTIPSPEYQQKQYKQFFIDFKTNKILEICSFTRIKSHNLNKMSNNFQLFCKLIRNQFSSIQIFIAYALNVDNNIAQQVCLNIYYTNDINQQLTPLLFNLKQFKVSVNQQKQCLPFIITKKSYVDWFKFFTHVSLLENLQKCFQK